MTNFRLLLVYPIYTRMYHHDFDEINACMYLVFSYILDIGLVVPTRMCRSMIKIMHRHGHDVFFVLVRRVKVHTVEVIPHSVALASAISSRPHITIVVEIGVGAIVSIFAMVLEELVSGGSTNGNFHFFDDVHTIS